ncbi:MAG: hypothetical protein ACI9T9_000635 [Oleiphilaceae bacterium]|jgi:hypothetical protein
MRTIKSYQEQVQNIIEDAIVAVEKQYKVIAEAVFSYAEKLTNVDTVKSKHNSLTDQSYSKAREVNKLIGEKAGEVILKFEKPETNTAKAKATAKKTVASAKKKATTAKTATVKAANKVATA